jgi:hypothetical protein
MAFFVMLSTFSNFGPGEVVKMRKVGSAVLAPNFYGGWYRNLMRAGMGPQMVADGQYEKGSEKPTLEEGVGKGLLAQSESKDFKNRKIFLIESKKVFWGRGATLSLEGRDFLNILASYVNKLPDRIVVSENGPGSNSGLGISRAVGVVEYLNVKGVSKDRCGVGTKGMLPGQNFQSERMLEIGLLDEGTYK